MVHDKNLTVNIFEEIWCGFDNTRSDGITVEGAARTRVRQPKWTWMPNRLEKDVLNVEFTEGPALHRAEWRRKRIHVANLKNMEYKICCCLCCCKDQTV